MDRDLIIKQLANEYGMEGRKSADSHYDYTTGTLFVGSKVYHLADMEKAKHFFRENKKKMHSFNDASSDLYEIGEIAVEALIKQSEANSGRLVVKEKKK